MKTIKDWRAAGFSLTEAKNYVDCTCITSSEPFYYFNPKFCDRSEDIVDRLMVAEKQGETYGFILAGDYHSVETLELPYELVSLRARNDLVTLYESMQEAQRDLERRRENFLATAKEFL